MQLRQTTVRNLLNSIIKKILAFVCTADSTIPNTCTQHTARSLNWRWKVGEEALVVL